MIVIILTIFTMCAFAANSILCRMALGAHLVDPFSFTTIRLLSGALMLLTISRLGHASVSSRTADKGSWRSGLALFVYAAMFSIAYISLEAGTGALILFAAVQGTMITSGLRSGERPAPVQWLGLAAAMGGLVYLVWPGIAAPDPLGAAIMLISGIAWGIYSIRGKKAVMPILSTAGNFIRTTPLAVALSLLTINFIHIEIAGAAFAFISGVFTSGLGYVLWYKVLGGLTTTQASVIQLLVPVLAAFGGIVILSEPISLRLLAASVFILGGVALAVLKPAARFAQNPEQSRQR